MLFPYKLYNYLIIVILFLAFAKSEELTVFQNVTMIKSGELVGTGTNDSLEAEKFFQHENNLLRQRKRHEYLAAYEYNTNVTEENRAVMISIANENAKASKKLAENISKLDYDQLGDESLRRQAKLLSDLGDDVLNEDDFLKLQNAISAMQTNYASIKVPSFTNPSDISMTLEPHIQERFSNSRDPKELEHYWLSWYNAAGTPMRQDFATYIELTRKAAKLNNYPSYAEYWIHFYEDVDFEKNLEKVYNAILPLYREIHAYVRYRLSQYYGKEVVSLNGNIPMHLLGNMWAQQWEDAIELYTPFPEKPFLDVKQAMRNQNFTAKKMFELGDEFFQSIGMRALPESFWKLSVLEKPTDRTIVCHASAWDLYQDTDVRIKMCTEVDTHYLYVVHHELGHIQYYMQYENQPTVFRGAPNPGFHEAVGDVIALSVGTPKHLHAIGLSPTGELDEESRINELFKMALTKVVFLPFALTMDKFRYAVFRDEIPEWKWNSAFWQMRSLYCGVEPPVNRTDADFDPPAKYHLSANVEYLRYFAAHIFQFQFHKAMCLKSGQYVPGDPKRALDNCDIFKSLEAGESLSKLLKQGASRHWKDVLEEFTGDREMEPSALLEYFEPLHKWLKEENRRLGVSTGWSETDKISKE